MVISDTFNLVIDHIGKLGLIGYNVPSSMHIGFLRGCGQSGTKGFFPFLGIYLLVPFLLDFGRMSTPASNGIRSLGTTPSATIFTWCTGHATSFAGPRHRMS